MSHNESIYAVVLAGGSGTRFWPASRQSRPKQLLPLNGDQSLLEATVRRAAKHGPERNVVISTNQRLLPATRALFANQPEITFLAEPVARNTAPCIAWATWKISQRDPQALVMVLPSDHHIGDEATFQQIVALALDSAAGGVIITLGIKPTRPDTGFGYIEVGPEQNPGVHRAKRFVEKPNQAVAESYLRGGQHLWNSGMFFFRADVLLAAVAQHLPALDTGLKEIAAAAAQGEQAEQRKTDEIFGSFPAVSIDVGIMEKVDAVNVVPASFGWSDIGSWAAVWELADKQGEGNATTADTIVVNAKGNLVRDFSGSPRTVALVGVDDLCVVQTDDAILIVKRDQSQ
ncbi:MAG TPA: mannose-1-phosphate guanylyltransferase, partial [Polyangiaceae bacterium]|nr:mannose-1-phosphate guanylyltransferase [Polyangiaceae bacterium]